MARIATLAEKMTHAKFIANADPARSACRNRPTPSIGPSLALGSSNATTTLFPANTLDRPAALDITAAAIA